MFKFKICQYHTLYFTCYVLLQLGVNKIVTGHNADDIAETVIMNILRYEIISISIAGMDILVYG